ncbi:MAG: pyruvate ferredoxin oxidoreductase, partial [Alphaproteobacteria bacterium]|nr:pyruvate ferredoxin oxidoreductase [Alphaproteobacteria bacterium]
DPVSIGALVGPEAFTEVKYLEHTKQLRVLERIPQLAAEFKTVFGRNSGGLFHTYRIEDAKTVIVSMGSVLGSIKDTVDDLRDKGHKIGVLGITSFRPFPSAQVRKVLCDAKRVVILNKSLAVGIGGVMSIDVNQALSGLPIDQYTVVAGLGGRAITKKSLQEVFLKAEKKELEAVTFLDLDWDTVNKQLAG